MRIPISSGGDSSKRKTDKLLRFSRPYSISLFDRNELHAHGLRDIQSFSGWSQMTVAGVYAKNDDVVRLFVLRKKDRARGIDCKMPGTLPLGWHILQQLQLSTTGINRKDRDAV